MIRRTTLALLLTLSPGCDCGDRQVAEGGGAAANAARPSSPEPPPLSLSILEAASAGEPAAVDARIDWSAVAKRALGALPPPEGGPESLAESAAAASVERGVAATLAAASRGEVSLRYLGEREIDSERWEIIRMTMRDGGFDHFGFKPGAEPPRAVDVFQLSHGQTASEQMRRGLIRERLASSGGLPEDATVSARERALAEHEGDLAEAARLTASGGGHDALHRLDGLPETVGTEPTVMLLRARSAEGASPNEHMRELERLAETHPDDPAVQLYLVDGFSLHGAFDRALEAIDRLAAAPPADPYFDVLRANVFASARRWAEAEEAASRAIEAEPSLADAYWPALVASLARNEYAETTALLLALRENAGVELEVETHPLYSGYVASPAYDRYRAALAR